MQVPIESIVIRTRVRKDHGDLNQLMESMKKYGLLSPILINRKSELIAGHRRLEAAKRLGWHTVNVVVIDRENERDKLEIEIEVNVQRKPFTTEELTEGLTRLERLMRPGLFYRILMFFRKLLQRLFGRSENGRTF